MLSDAFRHISTSVSPFEDGNFCGIPDDRRGENLRDQLAPAAAKHRIFTKTLAPGRTPIASDALLKGLDFIRFGNGTWLAACGVGVMDPARSPVRTPAIGIQAEPLLSAPNGNHSAFGSLVFLAVITHESDRTMREM
jgi:hypothetical protein